MNYLKTLLHNFRYRKIRKIMRKIRDEYEWDKYYEMQYKK